METPRSGRGSDLEKRFPDLPRFRQREVFGESGGDVGEGFARAERGGGLAVEDEEGELFAGVVGAGPGGSLQWSAVMMTRSSGVTFFRKDGSHASNSARAEA